MRIRSVSVCKSHFAKSAAQKTSIYKLAQFPWVRNLQSASPGGLSQAPLGGCGQDVGWAAIVWRLDRAGASLPVWPDIWPSKAVLVAGRGCGSSPQDLSTGLLMCPQTQRLAPSPPPQRALQERARWKPHVVMPAISHGSGSPALSNAREDSTGPCISSWGCCSKVPPIRWLKLAFSHSSGGKKSKIEVSSELLLSGRETLFLASLLASGGCWQSLAVVGL